MHEARLIFAASDNRLSIWLDAIATRLSRGWFWPGFWEMSGVLLMTGLLVLEELVTTDLAKIIVTALVTSLLGLVGLLYRQSLAGLKTFEKQTTEERKKLEGRIHLLEMRQRKMLGASLKLWAADPNRGKEALDAYREIIEASDDIWPERSDPAMGQMHDDAR